MRLIYFLALVILALLVPWYIFFPFAAIYAFKFTGYELLILSFCIDGYVGYAVPWLPVPAVYTLATIGILIFFWGLKPLLMIDR